MESLTLGGVGGKPFTVKRKASLHLIDWLAMVYFFFADALLFFFFFFPTVHKMHQNGVVLVKKKRDFLSVGGSVLRAQREKKSSVMSFVGKSENCYWKMLF